MYVDDLMGACSIAELASAPVSVPEANRRLLRHFLDLFGYET
jgi:hypothetical protein